MSTTPTPVKSVPVAASPQVVSVPVGIPQQLQQQLLQQQGAAAAAAQLVSATGQNLASNVMQTITVDGQEGVFIPATSLAGAKILTKLSTSLIQKINNYHSIIHSNM